MDLLLLFFLVEKLLYNFDDIFQVEMYGLPCDTVRREKKFRTKTIQNGLNPVFRKTYMNRTSFKVSKSKVY